MSKKVEKKESNKYNRILLIFLVLLLLILVGITYALFTYSKEGNVKNTVKTGSLTFSFTETSNGISLENAMPMSDEVGKLLEPSKYNNGYFDFNVSCAIAGTDRIQYEVYAIKEQVENELAEKYVKIYLTDGTTDKPLSGYDIDVPTFYSLKDSTSKEGAKQLYYGTFTSSGIQTFRLRMWISEDYAIPSSSENFKIKVNVEATNK